MPCVCLCVCSTIVRTSANAIRGVSNNGCCCSGSLWFGRPGQLCEAIYSSFCWLFLSLLTLPSGFFWHIIRALFYLVPALVPRYPLRRVGLGEDERVPGTVPDHRAPLLQEGLERLRRGGQRTAGDPGRHGHVHGNERKKEKRSPIFASLLT